VVNILRTLCLCALLLYVVLTDIIHIHILSPICPKILHVWIITTGRNVAFATMTKQLSQIGQFAQAAS
jgi:hypothetical protein